MKKDWNARLEEITQTDKAIWATGRAFAGIDEAGRGPLCGPVAAACVVMPPEPLLLYVDDSKKLTEKRREALYDQIMETAIYAKVILASPEEIDRVNILNATKNAMALAAKDAPCDLFLVDAITKLDVPKNKGYGTAEHIAALKQYGPAPIHRRSFIGHFVEG